MALSTNIHPISTHRVRPRAGLVIDRIWMRRKARGRTAYRSTSLARLLLQLVRLPRRANLREIDHGTGDRSADHFNSLQVASSDSDVFGQFQGAIGVLERRGATVSHGIEVHHRQRDGVGADWVHASDDHARAARGGSRDPRPFAGRHGFDAFDDGQMARFSFRVDVRLGAGAFVCGEKTARIASVEGKRGTPPPRPPYPAMEG